MRKCLLSGMAGLLAFGASSVGAAPNRARVHLYCLSLRFEKAVATGSGTTATFELGTNPQAATLNGEVAPTFNPQAPSHSANLRLSTDASSQAINGLIAFDLPLDTDDNTNTIPDVFEIDQSAGGTTQGVFTTPVDQGSVEALWNRQAGSATGTCRLRLEGQKFGRQPDFVHAFEIFEYQGELTYTPSTGIITGALQLTNVIQATHQLRGQILFQRNPTNRFDQLAFPAGSLTDSSSQLFSFAPDSLDRDRTLQTNYTGLLEFDDWDLSTPERDFSDWLLLIEDANDIDGNGIPDLSDDVAAPLQLSLALAGVGLDLTVRGTAGAHYQIEQSLTLVPPAWTRAVSVVLTNGSQTISLPRPENGIEFWRARAE